MNGTKDIVCISELVPNLPENEVSPDVFMNP